MVPFSNKFEALEEKRFRHEEFRKQLPIIRFAIFISALYFGLYGIGDYWLSAQYPLLWFIRYGILLPLVAAAFILTFTPLFRMTMQPVMMGLQLLYGESILLFVHIDVNLFQYYDLALLLVLFGAHTLFGLRFHYATSASLVILVSYFTCFLWIELDRYHFINYGIFLVTAFMLCVVIGYFKEQHARNDFLLRHQAEMKAMDLSEKNQLLHQLSYQDGLTGVLNRRAFDEILRKEWKKAVAAGFGLSLILIDIDDYKLFNDTYGHQKGDEALVWIADILKQSVREGDYIARYGGEEFVLILPRNNPKGLQRVAESIQQKLADLNIPHKLSPFGQITLSFGGATRLPNREGHARALLEVADRALYESKRKGKNTITIFTDETL